MCSTHYLTWQSTVCFSVCKVESIIFSKALGIESKKVCIGVFPKQYFPLWVLCWLYSRTQLSRGKYYAISEKEIPAPYTFFAGHARKRYLEKQGLAISEFLDDVRVDFLTYHRKGE